MIDLAIGHREMVHRSVIYSRILAALLIFGLLTGACFPVQGLAVVNAGAETLPAAGEPAAPAEGAPSQPTSPPASPPRSWTGAELGELSLPEQLRLVEPLPRNQAALRMQLDPGLEVPAHSDERKEYTVGDRLTFWVHNSSTTTNQQIEAELVHRTDHAYAWVSAPSRANMRTVKSTVNNFSARIYPRVTALMGSEPNPGVDGDPRLHILFTTGMGAGVAGYFSGADANPASVVPHSNEKEMFYISLNWLESMGDSEMVETVLAHEFQHMIHFNHDRNEEVWINEGLSEYAQEVAGYPPDTMFANLFTMQPDTQLNTWGGSSGNNSAHYGASYLFVRYLVQRFGESIARDLVNEPANGFHGVRAVLARQGATLEEVYADWLVANALDEPNLLLAGNADSAGRFGYVAIDPSYAHADALHDRFPVQAVSGQVANFAADYVELGTRSAQSLRLDFAGDMRTRIAESVPLHDAHYGEDGTPANRFMWSGRADDSEARLSHTFDLSAVPPGSPVTLSMRTWWQIEEDYDFGYVMASRDGTTWTLLEGERMSDDNPTGNGLGIGYTGTTDQEDGDREDGDREDGQPAWVTQTFDLGEYAGGVVALRFSYVTDDAVNEPGWLVDDLRIDAIGYAEDFEGDVPGWISQGWMLTDGLLDQNWMVQVVELGDGGLTAIHPLAVDAAGRAELDLQLDRRRDALLIISAMTEGTTLPAAYQYAIDVAE